MAHSGNVEAPLIVTAAVGLQVDLDLYALSNGHIVRVVVSKKRQCTAHTAVFARGAIRWPRNFARRDLCNMGRCRLECVP
jgi:hypothetical protein